MTALERIKSAIKQRFSKKYIFVLSILVFTLLITLGVIYIFALDESTWSVGEGLDTELITGSGNGVLVTSSSVSLDRNSLWLDLGWNYKRDLRVENISDIVLPQEDTVTVVVDTSNLEQIQASCNDLRVGYVSNGEIYEIPRDVVLGSGSTDCTDSKDTRVSFKLQKELSNPLVEGYVEGDELDSNYVLFYGNSGVGDTAPTYPGERYLSFDGVSNRNRVSLGNSINITQGENSYSLSFWVRPHDDFTFPYQASVIGSKSASYNYIYFNSPIILRHGVSNSVNGSTTSSWTIDAVNDGQWHHFIMVKDIINGTVEMYQNGQSKGINNFSNFSDLYPLQYIGGNSAISTEQFFQGDIDEVYFYDKLLSENEIEILNRGFLIKEGLFAGYSFDELEGQDVYDISDNGLHKYLGDTAEVETLDPTRVKRSSSVYDINPTQTSLVCPLNGSTTCVDGLTPTTETGAIRYSSGGSALEFDGYNDYVRTSNITLEELTYSAWVKSYHKGGEVGTNLQNLVRGSGIFTYLSLINGNLRVYDGTEWRSSSSSTNIPDGEWAHIAMSFRASDKQLKLYVNGVVTYSGIGLSTYTNGVFRSLGDFSTRRFLGSMDNIRLDNVVLSDEEVASIYNNGHPTIPEPNNSTVLLYHFDENGLDPRLSTIKTDLETSLSISGNGVAYDSSGNGNHGLIVGSKYTNNTPLGNSGVMSHEGILIEEGTTNKVLNPSFENTVFDKYWGKGYENIDLSTSTFTAKMAKRNGGGPFAGGVIVQGLGEDDDVPDTLTIDRGSQISGLWYETLDANQGSMVMWLTPAWDGNDGLRHNIYYNSASSNILLIKSSTGELTMYIGRESYSIDVSDWVAGSTYQITLRWDINKPLDGTHYASITINNTTTYGITTKPLSFTPYIFHQIGAGYLGKPANAIIEGLTIYRRVLFDGLYGTDIGNGNEIVQIYNSGVGKDPTEITGSWDVVLAIPTDGSTGELTTTNQAWSMPHSSNLLGTGGYMMGDSAGNDGWISYSPNQIINSGFENDISEWELQEDFLPTDIDNLKLWYDFSDSDSLYINDLVTNVSSDGDRIYTVEDKSGNNNHGVESNLELRPYFKENVRNGKSVVRFTGVGERLLASELPISEVSASSLFVVAKVTGSHSGGSSLSAIAYLEGTDSNIRLGWWSDRTRHNLRRSVDDPQQNLSLYDYPYKNFYIGGVQADWINGKAYDYMRVISSDKSGDYNLNSSGTFNAHTLYLGRYSTSFFNGDIGEVIIYNKSLTSSERSQLYTYFNNKWGIYSGEPMVTIDTSTKYEGSSSAKLVSSGNDVNFLQPITLKTGYPYNYSTYAYTNGNEVTNSDLELYYNDTTLITTYESAGNGWYKLTSSLEGISTPKDIGVRVKANKQIYLDNFSIKIESSSSPLLTRIFNSGYSVFSDTLGGLYKDINITTGKDLVVRGLAHSDGTSIPRLSVYDVTNDLEIAYLDGTNTSTKDNPNNLILTAEGTHAQKSTGSITLDSNPSHGDMVEIGGITYTFSNDLRNPGTGEILVGTDSTKEKALENLYNAIGETQMPGNIANVYDISVDSNDNIYVLDSSNHRVQVFNKNGVWLRMWGSFGSGNGQFNSPRGIFVRGSNVYISDTLNHRIQKFDLNGNYIGKFGTNGSGNLNFSSPVGIFVDSQDNIYIADYNNHRIQVFNSSFEHVRSIGVSGTGDGQLRYPYDVFVKSDGTVYITDRSNYRIAVFSNDGTWIKNLGSSGTSDGFFYLPRSLLLDSEDNMYISQGGYHKVQKFDSEFNYISKLPTTFSDPEGIAMDSEGNIIVADRGNFRIAKFSSSGTHLQNIVNITGSPLGLLTAPSRISYNNNRLYAADSGNSRVQVFDTEGNIISSFGYRGSASGQFNSVGDIAFDSSNNIYVTNPGNGRIDVFDSEYRYVRNIGYGVFNRPNGIELGPDGKIYVSDFYNHNLVIFENNGVLIGSYGSRGSEPGQMEYPGGLALDSLGNIYIADRYNHRITVFNNDGTFQKTIGQLGTGPVQFSYPRDIYIDNNDVMYIADHERYRIQKIQTDGTFLGSFGSSGDSDGQFRGVHGCVLDSVGNIYTIDNASNKIQKFDSFFNQIGSWGTSVQNWGYTFGTGSTANPSVNPNRTIGSNIVNLESKNTGLSSNNITLSELGNSTTVSGSTLTGGTDNSSKLRIKLLNSGSGVSSVNWHQVEIYNNLFDNPSFERGSYDINGNWIVGGWTHSSNYMLPETNDCYLGKCLYKDTNDSSSIHKLFTATTIPPNTFFMYSTKLKSTDGLLITSGQGRFRTNTSVSSLGHWEYGGGWSEYSGTFRRNEVTSLSESIYLGYSTGTGYYDEVYLFPMDSVNLSVTPASYEQSQTDDGGIVVNGHDNLSIPMNIVDPNKGVFRFDFVPMWDDHLVYTQNTYYLFDTDYSSRIALYYISGKWRFLINGLVVTIPTLEFSKGQRYSVEAVYDANGTSYIKIDDEVVASTTDFTGFTTTGPTTLYLGTRYANDSKYDATFYPYPTSTVTKNTTVPYTKYGNTSVKIVTNNANDEYLTELDLGNTNNHTISAYVYNNTTGSIGSPVDANIAQLVFNNTPVTTTYTDEGGGWWRLSYTGAGVVGNIKYGVQVKANKNVYIDGLQIEEKSASTTYADGSLGNGYSWSGTANDSSSTRDSSNLTYNTNLSNPNTGSLSVWFENKNTQLNGRIFSLTGFGSLRRTTTGYQIYRTPSVTCPDVGLNTGEWVNLVINWDAQNYVNCCTNGVCSDNVADSFSMTNGELRIGSTSSVYGFLNSKISDLKLFEEPLTSDQVTQLYNQGMSTYNIGTSNNEKYEVEGVWTSQVIDLTNNGQWGVSPALQITDSKQGGDIIYKTRTSPDNSTWTEYEGLVFGQTGHDFLSPPNRYMQIQATLTSTNQTATPSFSGLTFNYIQDTVKPVTNASNIQYYSSPSEGLLQTPNDWTNISLPYISWDEGADDLEGSGLRGYCLYLGQDEQADPALGQGLLSSTSPVHTSDTNCGFIISTPYIDLSNIAYHSETWMSSSNSPYYFKVKAVDMTGNVYGQDYTDAQTYMFKLDITNPINPKGISAPQSYQREIESFRIFWADSGPSMATDANSGVKGFQYKIGDDGIWYGTSHTGNQDCDDLITGYSYTLQEQFEGQEIGDELDIGENIFYLRTWDNICNVAQIYATAILQYSADAPSRPTNLDVDPITNTVNEFSFTWDIPETFSGQESGLRYCYTVNTLPSNVSCNWTSNKYLNTDAYANQPGENTFYIVTMDEAGNVNYGDYASTKFSANTSAPGMVQNLEISDISIKSTSKWRLAISWDEPLETGAGVSSYKIYRSSTKDSDYNEDPDPFISIGSTSGESFTDVNLAQTTYYYIVKACDSANNCSAASNTVSMLPTGRFYEPAEIVTLPKLVHVSTKSATINWITERESDSKIQYGLSSGEYFEEEISNSEQVVDHNLTLSNLGAGTTYFFKARWTDEDGNTGVTDEMSFTTKPPPSVKDVQATYVNLDNAAIRFTTKGASKVRIYYGKNVSLGGSTELETASSETTYTVALTGLDDGTKYFYKINLFDTDGNEYDGTVLLDFTTPPRPKVENVQVQEKYGTAQPTIEVTWESNTEVNSVVRYYPSGSENLAQNRVDITMKKGEHKLDLMGLLPTTTYLLRVEGTDRLGNTASSEQFTFTTATDTRPPEISDLRVDKAVLSSDAQPDRTRSGQLIVSWKTDEPATSQVAFGSGLGDDFSQKTNFEPNLKMDHVVIISNLSPSTVYHLKAVSFDAAENEGQSSKLVSVTPKATNTVLEVVVESLSNVFRFLR